MSRRLKYGIPIESQPADIQVSYDAAAAAALLKTFASLYAEIRELREATSS